MISTPIMYDGDDDGTKLPCQDESCHQTDMGVVVPHGVLFRGSSEGKIRQKLIEENLLDAVIGQPWLGRSVL